MGRVILLCTLIFSILLIPGCTGEKIPSNSAAQLKEGWDAYGTGEYPRAASLFEAAAKSAENSDAHWQGLYGQACVWNFRRPGQDAQKAAALYSEIATRAPKHDLAAWSLLALARMKHVVPVDEEPDFAIVRKAYQDCIDRFPTHAAGEEAFIYQQSTYVAKLSSDDAQKAASALETFIAQHAKSPFVSAAWLLLGEAYGILKQHEKALQARVHSLETEELDPLSPPDRAIAYWQTASIAEFDAGDFTTARTFYKRLIDEYPNDMRLFAAKTALKRMDELEAKLKAEATR
jgi:tetratricopeptide (TPR) repeat protein